MPRRPLSWAALAGVNVVTLAAFGAAAYSLGDRGERRLAEAVTGDRSGPRLPVSHRKPYRVEPLYNDTAVVSDDELRDVLAKVRPLFKQDKLSPNYVEHALRTWGAAAKFGDPAAMDGPEMVQFLTDHGRYMASWGEQAKTAPLLLEEGDGVAISWGHTPGQSVHHDHWLACLTEAGVPLDMPIFAPGRSNHTLEDALQEAARDFDPAERETEWSVMAFGFWLPPETKSWTNRDGREIDFNLLADILVRGDKRFGVCSGTHRVYSLMLLLRLDDRFKLLTPESRAAVVAHLKDVRDLMTLAQWEDGRIPADWPSGAAASRTLAQAEAEAAAGRGEARYKQVIATGHHLEWLAIAYPDLHPNREVVKKAAGWLVKTVRETPQDELMTQYTFFSHVGNALALWRKTHPAAAWPVLKDGGTLTE